MNGACCATAGHGSCLDPASWAMLKPHFGVQAIMANYLAVEHPGKPCLVFGPDGNVIGAQKPKK